MKFEDFFKQCGKLFFSEIPKFIFTDIKNIFMAFIKIFSDFFTNNIVFCQQIIKYLLYYI